MLKRSIFFAPLVAACSQSPAPPIPSAPMDGTAGSYTAGLSQQQASPCGYTLSYDATGPDGTPTHLDVVDRITDNAAGLDVAEHAVDAHSGAQQWDDVTAYDAAGNFVTWSEKRYDGYPDQNMWAAYDSFERLIRYSGDQDGDGIEDWIATYGYDGDGRRATAHIIDPGDTFDRVYHYGDDGRLAELDVSDPAGGPVDAITKYTYDDDARTQTRTVTDASGKSIGGGHTTYDDANHPLDDEQLGTLQGEAIDTIFDRTWDGDQEVQDTFGTTYTPTTGPSYFDKNVLTWTYVGCK